MGFTTLPTRPWASPPFPEHPHPPWVSPSFPGHPHPPRATQPFPPVHVPHHPFLAFFTVLNTLIHPFVTVSNPIWPYSVPTPPLSMSPPLPWPCFLTSTSTMALLPYFYVYYGPVTLLPRLLWPYCLTSTSIVVLLLCVFSASIFHKKTPILPPVTGM